MQELRRERKETLTPKGCKRAAREKKGSRSGVAHLQKALHTKKGPPSSSDVRHTPPCPRGQAQASNTKEVALPTRVDRLHNSPCTMAAAEDDWQDKCCTPGPLCNGPKHNTSKPKQGQHQQRRTKGAHQPPSVDGRGAGAMLGFAERDPIQHNRHQQLQPQAA